MVSGIYARFGGGDGAGPPWKFRSVPPIIIPPGWLSTSMVCLHGCICIHACYIYLNGTLIDAPVSAADLLSRYPLVN